jgi:hypothetical protein
MAFDVRLTVNLQRPNSLAVQVDGPEALRTGCASGELQPRRSRRFVIRVREAVA